MGMFDKGKTQNEKPNTSFDHGNAKANGDPFERIGGAESTERSVYPIPGVYPMLYCNVLKMVDSRLSGDTIFVAEFDILESKVPDRPVGTSLAWLCNLRHLPSPGNVRSFLAALNGVRIEDVDAEGAKAACGPNNPCHGRLIRLEAVEVQTKKGNPFTACKWTAIPEAVQEKAAQLRVDAGFPAF